jgi:hypothetical protein
VGNKMVVVPARRCKPPDLVFGRGETVRVSDKGFDIFFLFFFICLNY